MAHGRLKDWGRARDTDLAALGWSGNSATEVMRQRAHGGDASTAPGDLTVTELHCDRVGRTLQTELAVRSLGAEQRAAVVARYVEDRTIAVWANEHCIPEGTAYARLSRGVEAVGTLLRAWSQRLPEIDDCLRDTTTTKRICRSCKDVAESSYVAVTVPERKSKRRKAPLLSLPPNRQVAAVNR